MSHRLCLTLVVALALAGCRLKVDAPADIPPPPDVAAPPADAVRTASGIASKVLQVGLSNVRPNAMSTVRVHYTGWTTDGKMFDSSIPRGQPQEFGLRDVIPGWTEGVQLMVVGEKRRFWIPGKLAYGDLVPGDPPGSVKGTLVFDIELIAVQ